jgi:integrase
VPASCPVRPNGGQDRAPVLSFPADKESQDVQVDLDDYRQHLRAQGYSPATMRTLTTVVANCAAYRQCKPAELEAADVTAYLGRDLAPRTRRVYLWALRSFAEWAGLGPITSAVRRPRIPRGLPRPASESDLRLLLEAATPRTRAFVVLGAYAGLRSFETAKVRGCDFEVIDGRTLLRVQGKGGRVDVVPLPPIVLRELQPWQARAGTGRLFPGAGGPAVQRAVLHAADKAGVAVTSHMLRHRYGTQLYAVSRDLLVVQRLMRHSSPVTTAGYAQVLDEVGAGLVDLLP